MRLALSITGSLCWGPSPGAQLQCFFFFFFNDTAPPETSPLPLHAALPISPPPLQPATPEVVACMAGQRAVQGVGRIADQRDLAHGGLPVLQHRQAAYPLQHLGARPGGGPGAQRHMRSEERRVGEGGRSWWVSDH